MALGREPRVVVLNKVNVSSVHKREEKMMARLQEAAGHLRVLPILAATMEHA